MPGYYGHGMEGQLSLEYKFSMYCSKKKQYNLGQIPAGIFCVCGTWEADSKNAYVYKKPRTTSKGTLKTNKSWSTYKTQ